ncbi:MAG: AAA family ATPase, partial [Gammaproteobacteria bacterium]|nr:AAA family ATPase [Gammaproteobacteria bacterium]
DEMRRYDWPGNIRELKNVMERAVILSREDGKLDLSLPTNQSIAALSEVASTAPVASNGSQNFVTEAEMKEQQRENIRRALDYAGWRVSGKGGAAELLGLKPSTLTDRMRSLNLEKPANIKRTRRAS